ncbi:cytochrome c [Pendulispora brunnea]|uniref:Cytochrome c n=1 Tax=Pendulispora brunnea TaxID=2905690 RepID=A0ABZ2KKJ4_9BACT
MRAYFGNNFRSLSISLVAVSLGAATVALTTGCDRAPSASDAREWTPADHDRVEERGRLQSGAQAAPPAKAGGSAAAQAGAAAPAGEDSVVALTWHNQCASCHGIGGRGDGPNGPMLKAPDLTRAEWQAKVSDADIANVIRNGKNQMPRFDLSDKVVAGLVARVRAVRGK